MAVRVCTFVVGVCLFFSIIHPSSGVAGMNVNVNVNAPLPPLVLPAPPPLLPIPGTYAYFAPDTGVDIVFYHGYWYRPYEGGWYRATEYNGPWRHVVRERVPGALIGLPPDYRHRPRERQPIAYGQVKKNWRAWERDRHWDKHENGRGSRGSDRGGGHERGNHDGGGGRGHSKKHGD